jgi:hypothetical protein
MIRGHTEDTEETLDQYEDKDGEAEEQLDVIDVRSGAKGNKQEVGDPKKHLMSRSLKDECPWDAWKVITL